MPESLTFRGTDTKEFAILLISKGEITMRSERMISLRRWLVFSGVLASLTGSALADSWTTKAPVPTARYTLAAGALGGKVYAVGGQDFSTALDRLDEYDPATNGWTSRMALPTPRGSLSAAVVGGKLYSIGGAASPSGGALSTVEAYDPITDSWIGRTPMPTPRWAFGVGVLNGIVYAVGGYNGSIPLAMVEAYDPVSDSWSTKMPLPSARSSLAVGVANGKLYAIGGHDDAGARDSVEMYDPSTNSWTSVQPMPTARWTHSVAGSGGLLYAIGGNGADGIASAIVEIYDPASNSWSLGPSMPSPRLELAAATSGNTVYALAGLDNNNNNTLLTVNEALTVFLTVVIDIKPDSFPNSINLDSAGSVPVAILSSASFDATQVDPDSVTLAGARVRLVARGSRYQCGTSDVNGDGRLDLLCHVETAQFMLQSGDAIAQLQARTFDGREIRGEDSISIVP